MSGEIKQTSNFKSAKIWITFLFYVLSFFKKGDTIQGGTLFKGGHYLRKYGILFKVASKTQCKKLVDNTRKQVHTFQIVWNLSSYK